ncbi:MAG: acetyltransferase [Planctomycetes bacterium]|nr:acetyltransferase [Planctomycetota bacterium]MBI3835589.1 acetyltransferase [Planctomycetota bacterium]
MAFFTTHNPTKPTSPKANERPRCVIVGCGGHGRVVLDILGQAAKYDVLGFIDSNPAALGHRVDGLEVLGRPDDLRDIRDRLSVPHAIVAIGHNGVRRALADRLENWGFELINAIHPSANLARNVSLGRNIVIAAGALVCAHCQIGDSVILNTGCIIDHESLIGTATHVCPGARIAGRVMIESGAFVGIGATVIQSIRVGYEAVVGAGAVVIEDVAPMSTVVGVPAREIKSLHKTMDAHSWMVPELSRPMPVELNQVPV